MPVDIVAAVAGGSQDVDDESEEEPEIITDEINAISTAEALKCFTGLRRFFEQRKCDDDIDDLLHSLELKLWKNTISGSKQAAITEFFEKE